MTDESIVCESKFQQNHSCPAHTVICELFIADLLFLSSGVFQQEQCIRRKFDSIFELGCVTSEISVCMVKYTHILTMILLRTQWTESPIASSALKLTKIARIIFRNRLGDETRPRYVRCIVHWVINEANIRCKC